MTATLPMIRDLARRILADEAARSKVIDVQVDVAVRACAKLQESLSRLAGPAGFLSHLSRALALAKAEVPSLGVVQVRPDGSLAGFDKFEHDCEVGEFEKGRLALVAQLLELLATFIGDPLTQRLACEAWPDAAVIGMV